MMEMKILIIKTIILLVILQPFSSMRAEGELAGIGVLAGGLTVYYLRY
jgi:hypothetical protein